MQIFKRILGPGDQSLSVSHSHAVHLSEESHKDRQTDRQKKKEHPQVR